MSDGTEIPDEDDGKVELSLEIPNYGSGEWINRGNNKRWTPDSTSSDYNTYYDSDGNWKSQKTSYGLTNDADVGGVGALFGTDYPEACTISGSIKADPSSDGYQGYSFAIYLYSTATCPISWRGRVHSK